MSDTKEIDLEQCVSKEYSDIMPLPECKECEGHNYNCPSYYSVRQKIDERPVYRR